MQPARLWRDQGKVQQARKRLAPVYDWFTEGFGTPAPRRRLHLARSTVVVAMTAFPRARTVRLLKVYLTHGK